MSHTQIDAAQKAISALLAGNVTKARQIAAHVRLSTFTRYLSGNSLSLDHALFLKNHMDAQTYKTRNLTPAK